MINVDVNSQTSMKSDSEILACAMACRKEAADEVVLVTADKSLAVLAGIHGMAAMTLEEMRAALEVRETVFRRAFASTLGAGAVAAATGMTKRNEASNVERMDHDRENGMIQWQHGTSHIPNSRQMGSSQGNPQQNDVML